MEVLPLCHVGSVYGMQASCLKGSEIIAWGNAPGKKDIIETRL